MNEVALFADCTVRIVNERTCFVVREIKDLTEAEAYRVAKTEAESLSEDYGDDERHAERNFPFVPHMLEPFDSYRVEVLQRYEDGSVGWRGSRSVFEGYVTAYGRCAY